ncbi:peptidoglycan DD-metalloendopeptidase family protein [Leptolyngbya ohadii]|uniref:peptidoglycan DD-metalloendopeptidase family protein n=1 Tax=Leptolyngbya ohadii TaxID=1962290 RepID=UPI0021F0E27D|nr:peptidoglycan DD-metalloendopeptidase family protein [Leptolyngbya ohadii]
MKHILKPVGHCLATAVITSTLLRVYPAAIASAANPEVSSPTASGEAQQTTNPSVDPPAAAPDVPVTVESIISPEVNRAIVPTEPVSNAADQSPEAQTAPEVSEVAAPESDQPTAANPAAPQAAPQNSLAETAKETAKETPAPSPTNPRSQSVAAMRQQIDEKLAAIVARDRATREAQLQQNLIRIALQYAETGAFEEAREIARHPALPTELQTELLAKIDQMAGIPIAENSAPGETPTQTEGQTPVAAVPVPDTAQPGGVGRVIPLGAGLNFPVSQPWTGTYALPQCPAEPTAPVAAQSAAENPAVKSGKPPQFGNRVAASLVAAVGRASSQRQANQLQTAQTVPNRSQISEAAKPEAAKPEAVQPEAAKPEALQAKSNQAATTPVPTANGIPELKADSILIKPLRSLDAVVDQSAKNSQEQLIALDAATFARSAKEGSISLSERERLANQPANQPLSPEVSQTLSPLELMGYWISKPLKQVGIRLPFLSVSPGSSEIAVEQEMQTIGETGEETSDIGTGDISNINDISDKSKFASGQSASGQNQTRSQDLLPPVISFGDSLLNFPDVVTDLPPLMKDAVKVSPPAGSPSAAQAVSQKTTAPAAVSNCFPVAGSTNVTVSPALSRQMGWKNFAFPLAIPAVLTSGFGWRIHPISGDRRLHTGIDLGAPMGTPVVAAAAGRVIAADDMGGYGLTVIVETAGGNYRNLYAHLSGIAVRPGVAVQQGTVLGWVGSTGYSTGPHLHFEVKVPTSEGWMAIDPLAATAEAIASRAVGE